MFGKLARENCKKRLYDRTWIEIVQRLDERTVRLLNAIVLTLNIFEPIIPNHEYELELF